MVIKMYIAADMGTTNTRLWLCEGDKTLASKKGAFGAGSTKSNGREYLFAAFKSLLSELLASAGVAEGDIENIIVSGMAGSEIGLCEVPHAPLPADIAQMSERVYRTHLDEICAIPFIFVRGIKKTDGEHLCDIMRGEETETVGILGATEAQSAVLVLPGTHNKIIKVDGGAITDFYTTMSGELMAAVASSTILSGEVSYGFSLSERDLLRGADYARDYGLSASLFHVRVMSKNGENTDALTSFMYGAVISEDTALIERVACGREIYVGGREVLRRAYNILLGGRAHMISDDIADNAVKNGLMRIYKMCK